MPIPANQVTHVELKIFAHSVAGGSNVKNFVTTFHFRRTATALAVPKAAIDTAFQATIVTPILAALSLRYLQLFNTVRYLNDALDPPTQFVHANPGLVVGDSMPLQNYVYILMRSGVRGKSYRGHFDMGPVAESHTTTPNDDVLNAAALVLYGAVVTAVSGGFTDGTGNIWIPSIVSRKLSTLKTNPTTVIASDVAQIIINKRIGRLKRREVSSVY